MHKKIRPLLITALVSALFLLALVAVALAAPPDFCGEDGTNPDHPSCTSTPTTTTTTIEPAVEQPCETITTLGGTGQWSFGCDWTPANTEASIGTIQIRAINGDVSRVVVFVRDSDPGDICLLEQWDKPTSDLIEASFPLVYKNGETYWTQGGTHWCTPFDPAVGERTDLNGSLLHVDVSVRGKKGTVVEVTLTPGQTE